jgi:hypothetical protein
MGKTTKKIGELDNKEVHRVYGKFKSFLIHYGIETLIAIGTLITFIYIQLFDLLYIDTSFHILGDILLCLSFGCIYSSFGLIFLSIMYKIDPPRKSERSLSGYLLLGSMILQGVSFILISFKDTLVGLNKVDILLFKITLIATMILNSISLGILLIKSKSKLKKNIPKNINHTTLKASYLTVLISFGGLISVSAIVILNTFSFGGQIANPLDDLWDTGSVIRNAVIIFGLTVLTLVTYLKREAVVDYLRRLSYRF